MDVLTAATEMGADAGGTLKKVMDCGGYRRDFAALVRYTPLQPEVPMEHLVSAVTLYYSSFSVHTSPFDDAMNDTAPVDDAVRMGFNLFMSKAQCATCHFAPRCNGVKPPYIGAEFEVIGVQEALAYAMLSDGAGRFGVNPAPETLHAFRTGGSRNIARTAPYMHNGVFRTLREVIDLYNAGGGIGHGLDVSDRTLSSDSLALSEKEKVRIEAFMRSLNEELPAQTPPPLPASKNKDLHARRPGGTY